MDRKIPWETIYKEFRSKYPNLSKNIIDWRPYGYLAIVITCRDNTKVIYDYMRKQCDFIDV